MMPLLIFYQTQNNQILSLMKTTKTLAALFAALATTAACAQNTSAYQWPDSIYACVDGADYLGQDEKQVVIEINKARTNPVQYALEVLVPYMHSIDYDNVYTNSQGYLIRTEEGQGAVDEAINAMHLQKPMPMLRPQQYLALAAHDLCDDLGPKGKTGHTGTDGSTIKQRIARHNSDAANAGCSELSSYGNSTPMEIVRSLVVDDGVPSRANRKYLFDDFGCTGIAIGTHAKYGNMCVMVFQNAPTKETHATRTHTPVAAAPQNTAADAASAAQWPDSIYSVVAGATYLSQLEKDAIVEVNKARTNPARYAEEVLVPHLEAMASDNTYTDSNGRLILTHEGTAAIEEAIAELRRRRPTHMLRPKQTLYLAALDHCKDCGPKGITGHDGSDGSTPTSRIKRYDPNADYWGENIDYGSYTGMEIVRSLIVDDNVPGRGHRKNTFGGDYRHVGVATGTHATYSIMAVFDFSD